MMRHQVLTHIKDKNLKSKLYRSENLTLPKLLEVVSQYHDTNYFPNEIPRQMLEL